MDIKRILTEDEKEILYKAANHFQKKGKMIYMCPRCGGELKYIGNNSAYRISCQNNCGVVLTVRGI